MVPRGGVEPPTRRFSVVCSTTELPGRRHDGGPAKRRMVRRANECGPMAKRVGLGKPYRTSVVPLINIAGDIFGICGRPGHRIAIVEPAVQVLVAAPRGTEGGVFLGLFRRFADRAGLRAHSGTIWACGASNARPGSARRVTCRPVRRRSSSSQSARRQSSTDGCA